MKKIYCFLVVIFVSTLTYCQNTKSDIYELNNADRVQIKSVDFSIMTPISVDCNNFEEAFQAFKLTSINDSEEIIKLLNQFENLELIDSTYSKSINTRAIIKVFAGTDSSIICVGGLSLKRNGILYKTPQTLKEIIEKL